MTCEVIIAASGDQKTLLEREFPDLRFVEIPGYGIKYGKNRAFTILKIISQIPKILIRIKRENGWFQRFLRQESPDIVISDNRYGLYSRGIICVFLTHQLTIRTPFGKLADRWLQMIQYRAIRRFSICWVPDLAEFPLAGALSHPRHLPVIPVRYIGALSRFGKIPDPETCDLIVLLSGPEPQRTILEKLILDQLTLFAGTAILVRGLPGGNPGLEVGKNRWTGTGDRLRVYDHLPAAQLNTAVCSAGLVISRPGYSSVMDLFRLGKKCIFVPTPGQTEQEYLGSYLSGKRLAVCCPQKRFSLPAAIVYARQFPFAEPDCGKWASCDELLREAIGDLVRGLGSQREG